MPCDLSVCSAHLLLESELLGQSSALGPHHMLLRLVRVGLPVLLLLLVYPVPEPGGISILLLEWLPNAVQPPGSTDSPEVL